MRHLPQRRSLRLKGHDYAAPGLYFVTICVRDRVSLFGEIVNGTVALNAFGNIAATCWQDIVNHFQHVSLDEWAVMPDHVHGIIKIGPPLSDGATHASPLPLGPKPGSLGTIVGSYKSTVTKGINLARRTPGQTIWQRDYHDRIIQDDRALDEIRHYIRKQR